MTSLRLVTLMEAGSIVKDVAEGPLDSKKALSDGVGDGEGVRSLLALSLACGDG